MCVACCGLILEVHVRACAGGKEARGEAKSCVGAVSAAPAGQWVCMYIRRRFDGLVLLMGQMRFRYTEAAEKLQTEASLNLAQIDVADNIDLVRCVSVGGSRACDCCGSIGSCASIVMEFEEYYEMRFSRKPKLLRKVAPCRMLSCQPVLCDGSACSAWQIVSSDADPYRMANGVRDQVAARQGGRLPKVETPRTTT